LTELPPYAGVDKGVVGQVRIAAVKRARAARVAARRFITNMDFANVVTVAVESDDERPLGSCMVILEEVTAPSIAAPPGSAPAVADARPAVCAFRRAIAGGHRIENAWCRTTATAKARRVPAVAPVVQIAGEAAERDEPIVHSGRASAAKGRLWARRGTSSACSLATEAAAGRHLGRWRRVYRRFARARIRTDGLEGDRTRRRGQWSGCATRRESPTARSSASSSPVRRRVGAPSSCGRRDSSRSPGAGDRSGRLPLWNRATAPC
jgi:hypothetical protein